MAKATVGRQTEAFAGTGPGEVRCVPYDCALHTHICRGILNTVATSLESRSLLIGMAGGDEARSELRKREKLDPNIAMTGNQGWLGFAVRHRCSPPIEASSAAMQKGPFPSVNAHRNMSPDPTCALQ